MLVGTHIGVLECKTALSLLVIVTLPWWVPPCSPGKVPLQRYCVLCLVLIPSLQRRYSSYSLVLVEVLEQNSLLVVLSVNHTVGR